MPVIRSTQANLMGLTNPGAYIDQILPTPNVIGAPSNREAVVGVASWGPVGVPLGFSTPNDCAALFGRPKIRKFDMPTLVWAASQLGGMIDFRGVRVTDGTDTAASAVLQTTGGTATARYSGSYGNSIAITFQNGANQGQYSAVISAPSRIPERFENISNGVASLTATAGTGYTSIPTLSIAAPAAVGGVQAQAQARLKVVSATQQVAGTGYVTGDTITLANGVVLTVTASAGAITGLAVTNAGILSSGAVPTNPQAVVSTSGSGTGATINTVWGLADALITEIGSGYATTPAVTVTGGGGSGGSYTAVQSFWAGLQRAINNGNTSRSKSDLIVFSAGALTSAPTLNTAVSLSGGTDGSSGVGSSQMLGQDTLPRKGMYALRSTGIDAFALADLDDSTTWAAQLAFAISEACEAVATMAAGGSISDAVTARQTAGIDDPSFKLIAGDWPTFYDTENGLTRLVSPQAFALGLFGNLSPEQSPINKALGGVVATETAVKGLIVSSSENSQAQVGGIDVIGKSADLGADYFSFLTGRNSSSNSMAQGDEYTRLTNYLTRSLLGPATRSIVGKLQSSRPNDPTRAKAKAILDSFFSALMSPSVGSDGNGMIDGFHVTCDLSNNPPALQQRGYLFAYCAVRYLNVVRYFVVQLAGGGNVTITTQDFAPTPSQFLSGI